LITGLKALSLAIVLTVLLVPVMVLMPLPPMPEKGQAGDFLISNVHVVDVRAGKLLGSQDVAVENGRITRIASTGSLPIPNGLVEIDATGKYVIPGLWDMHTHSTKLASQYLHPLFIANGVTGVREMWGCMSEPDSYIACQADRERWNKALENGRVTSPRFLQHSSFQINGGNEVPASYPDFFKARSRQEASQLVSYYADSGADFLKIYSELPTASYANLAEAAGARQLQLAGHRPLAVSLPELLAARQRTVEHPRLFLMECYGGAAEFRSLPDPLSAYTMDFRRKILKEQDAQRCSKLMAEMADSNTAWVPTLQVLAMSARAGDSDFRSDLRLRYIPWPIKAGMWTPDADNAARKSQLPGHGDTYARLYKMAQAHLAQAHTAGVEILLGTDAGDSYVFPGFSVHDELAEFVAAGLTPADAIRIATLGAARFSDMEDDFGTVEVGKVADFLLLNANPLENIDATTDIHALLYNGQLFDRAALDGLLEFAERQSGSIRFNLQLLWSLVSSPIVRVQFAD
jgi:hypothetical protein